MPPRGRCRIPKGWGNQDSVKVVYDNHGELEIPASEYVVNNYEPNIDDLPECGSDSED